MSESKKPRAMSPKGFLHKCTTRAANSAIAFLSAHRAWLETGELSHKTSPILAKLDSRELLPTPALREIQYAVMSHIIESDRQKLEDKIQAQADGGTHTSTRKPWMAQILNAAGVIQTRVKDNGDVVDLAKGFDLASQADRWVDRNLFIGAPDWYGVVEHTVIPGVGQRVERSDAIARILKQPKGPTVHVKGRSTKTLGFGVKVKESRTTFSGG
jgi:hypothetical protein